MKLLHLDSSILDERSVAVQHQLAEQLDEPRQVRHPGGLRRLLAGGCGQGHGAEIPLELVAQVLSDNPNLIQYQYVQNLSDNVQLMLVPASELDEARAHAGGLRIEPVETLDDALAILATVGGGDVVLPPAPAR